MDTATAPLHLAPGELGPVEEHHHTPEDLARLAELAEAGAGERVLTLREAADACGTTYTALRKRADRGGLATVKRGNVRMVPVSELERHGLLPGAEERKLAARVIELEREIAEHRLLTERTESELAAERVTREIAEAAMHEERAAAATALERLAEREGELERVAEAAGGVFGPLRAWRAARKLNAE